MLTKVKPIKQPNKLCQMTKALSEQESGHLFILLNFAWLFDLASSFFVKLNRLIL